MGHASIATILSLLLISHLASAKILLIGKNKSLSFDDIESNFTPMIKRSDQGGVLYVAEPLDACSDLVNTVTVVVNGSSVSPRPPYVLIIRGGCSFEDKIRNAQKAGYKAAIVYDYEDYGFLVSMAGNPAGVLIYGTFVSKATGEVLKKYAGRTDFEVWLMPSFETSAWSIMAISFISLLAMSAVLATCFFVRRHRVRRRRIMSLSGSDFPRMAKNLLRRMPVTIFNGVCDEASTSVSCAICIEDYRIGDKLRVLPCTHKFHVGCVDLWLGQRRSFCPVCKRDARSNSIDMPASEHTPLLSPSVTPTSSFLLSSTSTTPLQSAYELPISIRVDPSSPSTSMQSHTVPMYLSHSRSHTSFQNGSYWRSPHIPVSRSSADLRRSYNTPRQGSLPRSPHSRYTHILSPGNASRSWVVGSLTSRREHSTLVNDSRRCFAHFSSASSLPGC
ncbi:PREDICTED: receptor homology region, transmembrane domain- and RING domain-containing protein 4 [Camelina sativa]|uniref:Receptor homology region, transmembrane domain- and RING domain-containing protein 4 n=1 Tax=Camelina sativa TaxID=90675 RepID=A0ABM0T725_CAMSA|nr:PREDICTED: receptor homology region, transmembrane domain- and RING domain-containing protein 4 [Camelina sativa]